MTIPDEVLYAAEPVPPVELDPLDPSLITFTSGTAGEPKGVLHGQRYLAGHQLQAAHWLDARPGDLVWCTAASGWSKSARNVFIAPWIRDGYGQTDTGQMTGAPLGEPVRPGSMGRPLPGVELRIDDGELVADPATVPTFFLRYLGEERPAADVWRTGDRVRQDEDGFLFLEGRADDVIISAGYRIGPFESSPRSSPTPPSRRRRSSPPQTTSAARSYAPSSSCTTATRPATPSRASCRTTSSRRPPLTSTRAGSTLRPSCRRRRPARSGGAAARAG